MKNENSTKNKFWLLFYIIYSVSLQKVICSVVGVVGGKVMIPCNITDILYGNEIVSIILWYRVSSGSPIYSIDARQSLLSQSEHINQDPRLYLDVSSQPPLLIINPVEENDAGDYRCRIDTRSSRTKNYITHLKIVVPPKEVVIKDPFDHILNGIIGPFKLGTDVLLRCESRGGKPTPSVSWWSGDQLLDESYTIETNDLVVNTYTFRNLTRYNLLQEIRCQSTNTNLSLPQTAHITMDLYLEPLDVQMKSSAAFYSTGSIAEFECTAYGSRPLAQIYWYKGTNRLLDEIHESVSSDGNVSMSRVTFMPIVQDHEKDISCRVHNSILNTYIQDTFKLNIHFKPQITINLGSNLKYESIIEGIDVYLECSVASNPFVRDVIWMFEGKTLKGNKSEGVLLSNHSLVLQKVKRYQRGYYQCSGRNSEGESLSQKFFLRVKYKPICLGSQKTVFSGLKNEMIEIPCKVESDPVEVLFKWTFKSSSQNNYIDTFVSNGTTSILSYIPNNRFGFGTITCTAHNSIGEQIKPCIYHVVPADPPEAPNNCLIKQNTLPLMLHVECKPGHSIGLEQIFHVQVYDKESGHLIMNRTAIDQPSFWFKNLPNQLKLHIFAENKKGKSKSILLETENISSQEKREGNNNNEDINFNPILLLICAVGAFILMILCFILILRIKREHLNEIKEEIAGENIKKKEDPLPGEFTPDIISGQTTLLANEMELKRIKDCNLIKDSFDGTKNERENSFSDFYEANQFSNQHSEISIHDKIQLMSSSMDSNLQLNRLVPCSGSKGSSVRDSEPDGDSNTEFLIEANDATELPCNLNGKTIRVFLESEDSKTTFV